MAVSIAYWKLDETSGTSVADDQTLYPLTTVNTPTWGAGQRGNALTFSRASSQYAQRTLSSTDSLTVGTSDFTICFWVKFSAGTGGAGEGCCGTWNGQDFYWYVRRYTEGTGIMILRMVSTASFISDVSSTGVITDTAWHHVGISVVRSANASFYIDGVAAGTPSVATTNGHTLSDVSAAYEFNLGCIGGHSASFFLDGSLDDVQIFLSALTQAEIQGVMGGGAAVLAQVAYRWRAASGSLFAPP